MPGQEQRSAVHAAVHHDQHVGVQRDAHLLAEADGREVDDGGIRGGQVAVNPKQFCNKYSLPQGNCFLNMSLCGKDGKKQ